MPATWQPNVWIDYWSLYLSAIENVEALAELMVLAEARNR